MRKSAIVSIHILAWLLVIIIPLFIQLGNKELPTNMIVYYILEVIYHPAVFYTFFFLVIPATIYRKGKVISSIFIYVASIIGLTILKAGLILSIDNLFNLGFTEQDIYGVKFLSGTIVNMVFMVSLALLVRIALYWARDQRKSTEIALEEHKLEVELLKAQINPHFFFNTLNNIYSLVYKKSDDAPAAVMKLSEIMRYIIYDSKSQMVPMEKEVEQLENHIELERLRSSDPGFIVLETKGDFSMHTVPPMLFLSFAENAFKHGKRKVKNPGIKFEISAENGTITYHVTNYILSEPHNNHAGEGIGLQNTRRRLELLYPNCHKLNIIKSKDIYEVKLSLSCK